jgi:peptidoglycan/LPS O-acetylase OafA/YrhL
LFYLNGKYRTTFGDLSYATYLYGWPISLTCVLWLLPLTGFWPAMGIAVAATLAVAWASWKLVERPALRLKKLASTEMHATGANAAIGLS